MDSHPLLETALGFYKHSGLTASNLVLTNTDQFIEKAVAVIGALNKFLNEQKAKHNAQEEENKQQNDTHAYHQQQYAKQYDVPTDFEEE
ncbi:unnamed protein product [Rotaria sordida]|uniref:Uncharacterized protein n=1 Tax=Rotaria sordida TaxID=392033 RepID=A0A819W8L8_9BILA|nr:unnamed protein product [Rotaria sordida]CAF4109115.1 unnamed protein product [Rotaria sordida]CAF4121089.1 unnamed protein product [Rotaria sordida]